MGSDTRHQVWHVRSSEDADTEFRRVYEAHYGAVLAYCRRRTTAFDANDAASEVFTIVWRKIDDLPDDEKLLSWLYGIAYRVLGHHWRSRDRYKKLKRRLSGAPEIVEPGPDETVFRRSEDRLVVQAAQSLKRSDREILRLAGWEELPHGDIAEMLGMSVATVQQRFHRAKKRLGRAYDELVANHQSKSGEARGDL